MHEEGVATASASTAGARTVTQRLVVPDVLRGVAIVAMLIAHASVFLPNMPGAVDFVTANINAMASPLFALVMGMSAQLLRDRAPRWTTNLLQQILRGVFLVVLGLWLATWGSWVAVVLGYLGLLLIIGAPLLWARTGVVVGVLLALLAVSQPLLDFLRTLQGGFVEPAAAQVFAWLVGGREYRVLNLLPLFLIGALLVRVGLRRGPWLLAAGIAAPVLYASWGVVGYFDLGRTHSGDYFDTARDLGLVLAVVVVVILAATTRRPGAERLWSGVFVPLIACGQVALSLYLLHVGLIALWNTYYGRPIENFWPGWLVIVPGMILVGWLWWRFIGTGPVEWVMGWLTGRPKPLRRAVQ